MGQVLYRKYRSKSLDEVAGQDHIVKVLKQALKTKRLSHAYLFAGPRGVGKTSVARILAHEVNELPYGGENMHLDIIEIDGASNRRIDEIRELRERANILPTQAAYKVYIIDEVHMLTREAFNALLKTLEEPPAHCIFILATTEAHKLPDTIVSRTQRFTFKPIDKASIVGHLSKIAREEKIDISQEALELLAEHGDGSFRDSISLLDQLVGSGPSVSEQAVRELLGLPADEAVIDLVSALEAGDAKTILERIGEAKDQATNPVVLANGLSKRLRERLASGAHEQWIPELLRDLLEVQASVSPYDALEISLLTIGSRDGAFAEAGAIAAANTGSSAPAERVTENPDDAPASDQLRPSGSTRRQSFDIKKWPEVVSLVKNETASLYTALRLAEPSLVGDQLILKFQFPLHRKKIDQAEARTMIGRLIEDNYGARLTIECVLDKSLAGQPTRAPKNSAVKNELGVENISNIFGAAELLES